MKPTIKIIIDYAYSHLDISPPNIPEEIMEEILLTCTTKTLFRHPNGDIYLQVDDILMGSPLGPLLANYYMAYIENTVLDDLSPDTKPTVYCRYVDDIFVVESNLGQIDRLKTKFET